jgi:hypothetical protein
MTASVTVTGANLENGDVCLVPSCFLSRFEGMAVGCDIALRKN